MFTCQEEPLGESNLRMLQVLAKLLGQQEFKSIVQF